MKMRCTKSYAASKRRSTSLTNSSCKATSIRNAAAHPNEITINYRWRPAILLSVLALGIIYYLTTLAKRIGRTATKPAQAMQKLSWGNILIFVGPSVLIYSAFRYPAEPPRIRLERASMERADEHGHDAIRRPVEFPPAPF